LSTDFFQGNDDLIIDEIITFFLAGMKTIQVTTTNMMYYLTKHPEHKAKLLTEILPPVEAAKNNIVEDFNYDTVMEFEYL
jgi:cytochrome P450